MVDRLEELKNWFNTAPLGTKFPIRIDSLGYGFAEVSMDIQMGDLVAAGEKMIVQGGIIAVIADGAAVLAAMSVLPSGHTPLVHISCNIRSPTTLADYRLTASATVWAQDYRFIWTSIIICGASLLPKGNLKAVGTAQFAKPRK